MLYYSIKQQIGISDIIKCSGNKKRKIFIIFGKEAQQNLPKFLKMRYNGSVFH
jgi:hypothetical protein